MLSEALHYASLGWHIFPVEPKGKEPIQVDTKANGEVMRLAWSKHATTCPTTIRRWWTQWPDANIGLACGPSGLVVLDVDNKNDGIQHWQEIYTANRSAIPQTVTSHTGGGGYHLLYRAPNEIKIGNGTGKLPLGIDVRGSRGYIVLPPSIHQSGKSYKWTEKYGLGFCQIPLLPQVFINLIQAQSQTHKLTLPSFHCTTSPVIMAVVHRLERASEGNRNNLLLWAACRLFDHNLSLSEVESSLLSTALYIGLTEHEIKATIASAGKQDRHHSQAYNNAASSTIRIYGQVNTGLRQIRAKYRSYYE